MKYLKLIGVLLMLATFESIVTYKATEGWNWFQNIVEGTKAIR